MPEHAFHLTAVLQALQHDVFLAEALFYPEVSCLGDDPAALIEALAANARRLLAAQPAGDFSRRRGPREVEAAVVEVVIDPPPRSPAWREPVAIGFPVVRWAHGEDAFLAFIPALGIEVVAGTLEDRERMLPRHIEIAVLREQARCVFADRKVQRRADRKVQRS